MVAVRVQHGQNVYVHIVQDGGDVAVLTISVQRLRNKVIRQFFYFCQQIGRVASCPRFKLTHVLDEPQTEGV